MFFPSELTYADVEWIMTLLKCFAALLAFSGVISTSYANPTHSPNILILGVIAAGDGSKGVALVKDMDSKKTFAVRVGQEVAPQMTIRSITREYVYLRNGEKIEKVRVGEQFDPSNASTSSADIAMYSDLTGSAGGIERKGDSVKVTTALKDYVVGQNLSKVLMQAAAVPNYENGQLKGFTLWEIDKGSVYELAGFQDGDTITAINGQDLTDVGGTIKLLHSLKGESRAEVRLRRSGSERTLKIEVQ